MSAEFSTLYLFGHLVDSPLRGVFPNFFGLSDQLDDVDVGHKMNFFFNALFSSRRWHAQRARRSVKMIPTFLLEK